MTERKFPMPKALTIGGLPFKIKTNKATHHVVERVAGENVDGFSRLSDLRIFVDGTLPIAYRRVVLLHEVLHMALGVAGGDSFEEGAEERFVATVSATLLNALRENPDFVLYLLGESD